jgi:hypothetical protein
MSLPWVRLDTALPDHPKILALVDRFKDGRAAAFVYVCGLAYCGRHGTDGHIPRPALARINGRAVDAERLVEVGLWDKDGTGWIIHGWAEYQQSTGETQERAQRLRDSSKKANCVRWHGADCECWRSES